MERAATDQLDRVSRQVEPHQGLGVLPGLGRDLPHHVLRQVQLHQVGQPPEGLRLDLADLAIRAVDPLQVGDAHRQEDVVAQRPDVVASEVEHLSGGFDSRRDGVPVLVDAFDRLLAVLPHADAVGRTFGRGQPDLPDQPDCQGEEDGHRGRTHLILFSAAGVFNISVSYKISEKRESALNYKMHQYSASPGLGVLYSNLGTF